MNNDFVALLVLLGSSAVFLVVFSILISDWLIMKRKKKHIAKVLADATPAPLDNGGSHGNSDD